MLSFEPQKVLELRGNQGNVLGKEAVYSLPRRASSPLPELL